MPLANRFPQRASLFPPSPLFFLTTPSPTPCQKGKKKEIKLKGDKLADVKFRLGRGGLNSSCAPVGQISPWSILLRAPAIIWGLALLSLSGSWIPFHTMRTWKSLADFQKESQLSEWKSMSYSAMLWALGIPSLKFIPTWNFQDVGMTLERNSHISIDL